MPWGRIAVGETVWMKWSGGPVVARARVQGFRQLRQATAEALRGTTAGYRLHDLESYWQRLPPSFAAVVIYLEGEQWLDPIFLPAGRSRGESWIVVDRPELAQAWLQPRDGTVGSDQPALTRATGRGTCTISLALRFEVFRRDSFTYQYCGRRAPDVTLHVDHVIPYAAGGRTA